MGNMESVRSRVIVHMRYHIRMASILCVIEYVTPYSYLCVLYRLPALLL